MWLIHTLTTVDYLTLRSHPDARLNKKALSSRAIVQIAALILLKTCTSTNRKLNTLKHFTTFWLSPSLGATHLSLSLLDRGLAPFFSTSLKVTLFLKICCEISILFYIPVIVELTQIFVKTSIELIDRPNWVWLAGVDTALPAYFSRKTYPQCKQKKEIRENVNKRQLYTLEKILSSITNGCLPTSPRMKNLRKLLEKPPEKIKDYFHGNIGYLKESIDKLHNKKNQPKWIQITLNTKKKCLELYYKLQEKFKKHPNMDDNNFKEIINSFCVTQKIKVNNLYSLKHFLTIIYTGKILSFTQVNPLREHLQTPTKKVSEYFKDKQHLLEIYTLLKNGLDKNPKMDEDLFKLLIKSCYSNLTNNSQFPFDFSKQTNVKNINIFFNKQFAFLRNKLNKQKVPKVQKQKHSIGTKIITCRNIVGTKSSYLLGKSILLSDKTVYLQNNMTRGICAGMSLAAVNLFNNMQSPTLDELKKIITLLQNPPEEVVLLQALQNYEIDKIDVLQIKKGNPVISIAPSLKKIPLERENCFVENINKLKEGSYLLHTPRHLCALFKIKEKLYLFDPNFGLVKCKNIANMLKYYTSSKRFKEITFSSFNQNSSLELKILQLFSWILSKMTFGKTTLKPLIEEYKIRLGKGMRDFFNEYFTKKNGKKMETIYSNINHLSFLRSRILRTMLKNGFVVTPCIAPKNRALQQQGNS